MPVKTRASGRRILTLAFVAMSGAFLAACATETPKGKVGTVKTKEYFSEAEYGVKASPLVTTSKRSRLPRGGGREQIGKPYKVKGKWYKPKEDPDYVKVGAASWYGDAFHGRLTANGEIYDMHHLTAAHPTMPLPSYARVTNTKNGSSIIVRVNDRGPFARDRVIDLSKRAAEMLDYTHAGVAKVKVEYVGRAPLHGQDDEYLMASYIPPVDVLDPSTPPDASGGVMIAMNGPTPSAVVGGIASAAQGAVQAAAGLVASVEGIPEVALPAFGPAVPERPTGRFGDGAVTLASLSYADQRVAGSADRFGAFGSGMTPAQILASWQRTHESAAEVNAASPFVAVGTFDDRAQAEAMARELGVVGRTDLSIEPSSDHAWYTLTLRPDGHAGLDHLLEAAWAAGASDALIVRD